MIAIFSTEQYCHLILKYKLLVKIRKLSLDTLNKRLIRELGEVNNIV